MCHDSVAGPQCWHWALIPDSVSAVTPKERKAKARKDIRSNRNVFNDCLINYQYTGHSVSNQVILVKFPRWIRQIFVIFGTYVDQCQTKWKEKFQLLHPNRHPFQNTAVRTPQGRSVARPYFSWGTGLVSIGTVRLPTQSEASARSAFEPGPISWQVPRRALGVRDRFVITTGLVNKERSLCVVWSCRQRGFVEFENSVTAMCTALRCHRACVCC